jgi:ATP-dependent protease ClpP protease subunit
MKAIACISFVLACGFICLGDTFTNKSTGETFYGYPTQITKGNKTLIRTGSNFQPKYVDLSEYDIEKNSQGRRNKVAVININDAIEYECEVKALEKAIEAESNQGPEFILLEIDTPGGRVDLAERICDALSKADNCRIVAFVNGGAISAGAIVALACDEVYMSQGATIGGATSYVVKGEGPQSFKEAFGETVGEKMQSIWIAFCEGVAEKNNRPTKIVRAMIDKDISVVEVEEEGNREFICSTDKKPSEKIVKTWSEKGKLLTLTAGEAAECGIADSIVPSREELVSKLATKNARQVLNSSNIKVRQAYKLIEDNLTKIKVLEEAWTTLVSEIREIDDTIANTEKTNYRVYDDGRGGGYVVENEYASGARAVRESKIQQLRTVLRQLIKEYKNAILKGKKFRELDDELKELREGLKSAEKAYKTLM